MEFHIIGQQFLARHTSAAVTNALYVPLPGLLVVSPVSRTTTPVLLHSARVRHERRSVCIHRSRGRLPSAARRRRCALAPFRWALLCDSASLLPLAYTQTEALTEQPRTNWLIIIPGNRSVHNRHPAMMTSSIVRPRRLPKPLASNSPSRESVAVLATTYTGLNRILVRIMLYKCSTWVAEFGSARNGTGERAL